jgi:hypothetical protein
MTTALHPFQRVKLKTASGGSYQKPLKSFGDLTFATQYCTGFAINLSANSPPLSRFTSEDPIGFGGGMNFYGFVGNNPIGFFDLFGMEKSCHRITDWVPSTVMESAGNKGRLVRSFEQIQWSLQNQSNPAPFVSSQMPRGARTGQLIFSCRYVGSLIKTSIYEKLRLYEAKFECHDDCNSWTETQNKSQAEQYSKSIQEPTIGSLTKTRILWYPCPNFLVEDL